jgi:predicted branched-subunit amino acid permease
MAASRTPVSRGIYDWSWFPRGMYNLFSLPAVILISAFIGFGGLAREAGLSLWQLIFIVPTIWALPSHLILVAGIVSGAPILAIVAAVALAAIRMLPMTMALIPEIRMPRSPTWHLLVVSNLIAITAWVHTLQRAPEIPREGRLPYFCGFASTMMVATTSAAALVHQLAAGFPPIVMAGLYFLTPLYFACSIWNTARFKAEHVALVVGFCLGPVFFVIVPQANILFAGLVGGLFAFAMHQFARWKRVK